MKIPNVFISGEEMPEIRLLIMNEFWKKIILNNQMRITSTNCNPRFHKELGSMGFIVTSLPLAIRSNTYGVKLEKFKKAKTMPYDLKPIADFYHLQLGYITKKGDFFVIARMAYPVESFCHFKFGFYVGGQIHCEVVCAYKREGVEGGCITDHFGFWMENMSDDVIYYIRDTVIDYANKQDWIKYEDVED